MKKLLGTLLVICLLTSMTFASASVPVIVATASETATGTYVLYTPTADGNYRMSAYLESPSGASPFVCAAAEWTDSFNPIGTSDFCSDNTAHGQFSVVFHASSGNAIYVSVDSIHSSGVVYVVLEQL